MLIDHKKKLVGVDFTGDSGLLSVAYAGESGLTGLDYTGKSRLPGVVYTRESRSPVWPAQGSQQKQNGAVYT